MEATLDIAAISKEALDAMDNAKTLQSFSKRYRGFDLSAAYRVSEEIHRKRKLRGQRHAGRKIGFTNRKMWEQYGVRAPVWGYMYDNTVFDIARASDVSLVGFVEPKIEPEIAFGFSRLPEPGMTDKEIFDCVEWVSHGYEVVQSNFPGWNFSAADTVVISGLHGIYFVGTKMSVADDRANWLEMLAAFEIDLFCNDKKVETGHARNVLDGPVSALGHLLKLLADDPDHEPLAAGEIITTGTVTRAWPVAAGETWRTEVRGLKLPGVEIRFS